jgi:5-formyltetrahydrofolate cyclo-ligase
MGKRLKNELRREMRKVLVNLDRRWLQAASRELCKNISKLIRDDMDRDIKQVLAWVNFFPGEVDLSPLINEFLDSHQIFLPQVRGEQMQFVSIGKDWVSTMAQGEFGIPEPSSSSGEIFNPRDAASAAILVPGMAFDRLGGRLGRGKGYYDSFLGRSKLFDITKIGVGWSLQVLSEVPMESHDTYMDWLVTEEQIIPVSLDRG